MVLFFSVRGEGKCELNHKKKKNYFSRLGSVSVVRRRSRKQKKSYFKKKVLSAFFRHYG